MKKTRVDISTECKWAISTRRLFSSIFSIYLRHDKSMASGVSAGVGALHVCVLNKVPEEDRKVIAETFEHHVGPLGKNNVGS